METQKAKIIRNVHELKEHAPKGISLTLRPKDRIYLNQAVMIASAIKHLRETPGSKLRIDISDLDMDMQRGPYVLPYSKDPRSSETKKAIKSLIDLLCLSDPSLIGRITIKVFSEWLSDSVFMDFFSKLLKDPLLARQVKVVVSGAKGSLGKFPFFPICDNCDHVSSSFGKISFDTEELIGTCKNPGCNAREKIIQGVTTPGSYCVFYLLGNSGDVFNLPGFGVTEVHFTGLEPLKPWGQKRRVTAEIHHDLLALLAKTAEEVPAFYGAPRISDSEAKKLGFNDFLNAYGFGETEGINHLIDAICKNDHDIPLSSVL